MNDSFNIKTYVQVAEYPCDLEVGDILVWYDSKISHMVMITKFLKNNDSFSYYDLIRRENAWGERYWFRYWKILPANKCTKSGCACRGNTGC